MANQPTAIQTEIPKRHWPYIVGGLIIAITVLWAKINEKDAQNQMLNDRASAKIEQANKTMERALDYSEELARVKDALLAKSNYYELVKDSLARYRAHFPYPDK